MNTHHWHEDQSVPCLLKPAHLDAADCHQVATLRRVVACKDIAFEVANSKPYLLGSSQAQVGVHQHDVSTGRHLASSSRTHSSSQHSLLSTQQAGQKCARQDSGRQESTSHRRMCTQFPEHNLLALSKLVGLTHISSSIVGLLLCLLSHICVHGNHGTRA